MIIQRLASLDESDKIKGIGTCQDVLEKGMEAVNATDEVNWLAMRTGKREAREGT